MSSSHRRSSTLFDWFSNNAEDTAVPDAIETGLVIVNESNRVTGQYEEVDDLTNPLPLPSIDEFSFKSIVGSCQPLTDRVVSELNEIIDSYKEFLGEELEAAADKQREITKEMRRVDKLAQNTLTTTIDRTNKSQSAAKALHGIDNLVTISEQAYSNLKSIVTLLHDIDEMLPVQERLGIEQSAHKSHYPKLHGLLQSSSSSLAPAPASPSNILPRQRNSHPQPPLHHQANRTNSMAAAATSTTMPSTPAISPSSSLYKQPRRSISLSALASYSGSGPSSNSALLIHSDQSESLAKPVLHLRTVAPTKNTINDFLTASRRPSSRRPLSFFSKLPSSKPPQTAKDLLRRVINEEPR